MTEHHGQASPAGCGGEAGDPAHSKVRLATDDVVMELGHLELALRQAGLASHGADYERIRKYLFHVRDLRERWKNGLGPTGRRKTGGVP